MGMFRDRSGVRPDSAGGRRFLRRAGATAAALAVAATTATTAAAAAPQAAQQAAPASNTAAVQAAATAPLQAAVPKLNWGTCPPGWGSSDVTPPNGLPLTFSCATATVPLDYDKPKGATIDLALRRIEALDQKNKIGSIFINPGGPGGSGVDFVESAWALVTPEVRMKFDIVGFDPRGIARSAPAVCFKSMQEMTRTMGTAETWPINRAEYHESAAMYRRISAKCATQGGAIMRHMSTGNVARDLDMLRQAVGDKGLTFAGYSYGSQIGSTYAAMFPKNVRAMVVDGVLDPTEWSTGTGPERGLPSTYRIDSHVGAAAALQQFWVQCKAAGPSRCALAAQGDPEKITRSLLALTRREPVRVEVDGFVMELTYQGLVTGLLGTFYQPYGWDSTALIVALAAQQAGVVKSGPVPVPARVSKAALRTQAQRFAGAPMPQTIEGTWGVLCTDADNPRHPELWWSTGLRADKETNSYFGMNWTWMSHPCATWPFKDADRFAGPYRTTTSNPVLVIGTLYDPATDYGGAKAVAANLTNSRLLTVSGWGHTSLGASACALVWSNKYILTGQAPPQGTVCAPDLKPFDPVPMQVMSMDATTSQAIRKAREMVTSNALGS